MPGQSEYKLTESQRQAKYHLNHNSKLATNFNWKQS